MESLLMLDISQPRPNEAGGMYGRGEIVRTYAAGSSIPVGVELTANHKGYFEMRVCPVNSNARPATQRCLDRYKLQLSDGGGVRYYPQPAWNGKIQLRYRLPADLTCRQCVFQWRYVAGNNWGTCGNGTEGIGCGPQEEFRACADVRIVDEAGEFDETRYDWADGELGGTVPPSDERQALVAETIAAVVLGVLGALAFFVGVCCWALARRRGTRNNKKKRGVTFGRQIFLISNPTLTRNGKLSKPTAAVSPSGPVGAPGDTSAILEVSSSDGSTGSRGGGAPPPQFAADDQSPEPPVAPRRKRTARSPAGEKQTQESAQELDQDPRRAGAHLHISRPTQVTVNGVSVVPDPMPDVVTH
ncbi:uncharacterized protein LOC122366323 isoform X2 [Amphibalanus amphitrite]|uniref:uncharacterized protein LOC122366323 isoform X2 n=1 Tax=Amphibalanus amphitrite TaxID=1232801 RepID=UPI001C926361|nr:uncharacterized protein LOC122366323 isoform X2 [Amphibalanus amphitrite]